MQLPVPWTASIRGLARAGITLFRELPGTAANQVLLCTDLHAENILVARR
jgi:streptomycin 6-kinase